jgi:hypothetical protein
MVAVRRGMGLRCAGGLRLGDYAAASSASVTAPLRRVPECVFGVLALESESVIHGFESNVATSGMQVDGIRSECWTPSLHTHPPLAHQSHIAPPSLRLLRLYLLQSTNPRRSPMTWRPCLLAILTLTALTVPPTAQSHPSNTLFRTAVAKQGDIRPQKDPATDRAVCQPHEGDRNAEHS